MDGYSSFVHLERHVHRKPSHRRQRVYVSEGLVGPVLSFKVVATSAVTRYLNEISWTYCPVFISLLMFCSESFFWIQNMEWTPLLCGLSPPTSCSASRGLHDFVVCLPVQRLQSFFRLVDLRLNYSHCAVAYAYICR